MFLYTPNIIRKSDSECIGITYLQTDDTCNIGNENSTENESREVTRFKCEEKDVLRMNDFVKFNGMCISRSCSGYTITQAEHAQNMEKMDIKNLLTDSYIAERARGGYIASTCRPDLLF